MRCPLLVWSPEFDTWPILTYCTVDVASNWTWNFITVMRELRQKLLWSTKCSIFHQPHRVKYAHGIPNKFNNYLIKHEFAFFRQIWLALVKQLISSFLLCNLLKKMFLGSLSQKSFSQFYWVVEQLIWAPMNKLFVPLFPHSTPWSLHAILQTYPLPQCSCSGFKEAIKTRHPPGTSLGCSPHMLP